MCHASSPSHSPWSHFGLQLAAGDCDLHCGLLDASSKSIPLPLTCASPFCPLLPFFFFFCYPHPLIVVHQTLSTAVLHASIAYLFSGPQRCVTLALNVLESPSIQNSIRMAVGSFRLRCEQSVGWGEFVNHG